MNNCSCNYLQILLCKLASSPGHGHSQILSRSHGEKSGEGLGSFLCHGPEMLDLVSTNCGCSNDPRGSPDFSPQLRDKIWEWPGDEAICKQHTTFCSKYTTLALFPVQYTKTEREELVLIVYVSNQKLDDGKNLGTRLHYSCWTIARPLKLELLQNPCNKAT